MQILTAEILGIIAIVSLSVLCGVVIEENQSLMARARKQEVTFQEFLKKKVNGKPIANYVNQTSLTIIPIDKESAVVCGTMAINESSSRQKL